MTKITKMSICIEYDGKPAFVLIPDDKREIVKAMIMSLCEDEKSGKVRVVQAPAGFVFCDINDLQE